MPLTFSNNKKIIFGEYSPTTDSVSILTNAKNIKYEEMDAKLFNTKNILLLAGSEHERGAHLRLTKLSSFYSVIIRENLDSYIIFNTMIKSFDSKYKIFVSLWLSIKKLIISGADISLKKNLNLTLHSLFFKEK